MMMSYWHSDQLAHLEIFRALTGAAQWIGHCSANQKVTGLITLRAHAWVASQAPGWGFGRGT